MCIHKINPIVYKQSQICNRFIDLECDFSQISWLVLLSTNSFSSVIKLYSLCYCDVFLSTRLKSNTVVSSFILVVFPIPITWLIRFH